MWMRSTGKQTDIEMLCITVAMPYRLLMCFTIEIISSFPFDLLLPIFRNILCKGRELGVKTLAVCVVSTVQKNFPPDIGAHIALRKFGQRPSNLIIRLITLIFPNFSVFCCRNNSTLFGQIPKRNNYTLPWTTRAWNLWSASTVIFSTWYFRGKQRTVAIAARYWRKIWWTANFRSANSHHS